MPSSKVVLNLSHSNNMEKGRTNRSMSSKPIRQWIEICLNMYTFVELALLQIEFINFDKLLINIEMCLTLFYAVLTEYYTLGNLQKQKLFSHNLGAAKSKIKVLAFGVWCGPSYCILT